MNQTRCSCGKKLYLLHHYKERNNHGAPLFTQDRAVVGLVPMLPYFKVKWRNFVHFMCFSFQIKSRFEKYSYLCTEKIVEHSTVFSVEVIKKIGNGYSKMWKSFKNLVWVSRLAIIGMPFWRQRHTKLSLNAIFYMKILFQNAIFLQF